MMKRWYGIGLAARLALMLYGAWQDATMAVKYTDVDYYVFSDAALFVTQGESPYKRLTYRYPPVLAWTLTLNIWLSPYFGKVLFILADVLAGRLIYSILRTQGHPHETARNFTLVWLLNPLPAAVSSRGNAESLMAYLVLMSISYLMDGNIVLSAIFYALSIHFKIYPVTFALPIYLYLGTDVDITVSNVKRTENYLWTILQSLLPNRKRCVFISISALLLTVITAFCYWMYGWIFLYETYLYHVIRGDIRHNFSPYFYLLYLTSDPVQGLPLCLRLMMFLPQSVLLVAVAFKYQRDPPLSWFLCTFTFVMANKVCTSQYFLWYLSLLPLVLPSVKMSVTKAMSFITIWFITQGLWLLPAYYLEFQGQNTFLLIWAAGLAFFCANGAVVYSIVDSYCPDQVKV